MQYKVDDEDNLAKLQKSLGKGGAEVVEENVGEKGSETEAGGGQPVLATMAQGGRGETKEDSQAQDESFEVDELPGKWSETIVKVDRVQKVRATCVRVCVVVGRGGRRLASPHKADASTMQ